MSTPKVVPTLDDTPKEPRIKPKRCPSCQRPNKPEAVKCGTCGYDLDAPPPPPSAKAKAKSRSGGGGNAILLVIPLLLIVAGGGAVAYLGVDRALSMVGLAKPKPVVPAAKPGAKPSAKDAQKKALDTIKADAGACYNQFNDLMELSKKRGVDPNPNATFQAYLMNVRQLNTTTTASSGCSGDLGKADVQKIDLCEEASALKICLNTVMTMQRDRLTAAGYRIIGSGIERIKTEPSK